MLGQVSGNEYDLLLSKLAGAQGNQVFSFFGIEAPQRAADALLAVQKARRKAGGTGGTTVTLEKKKWKRGGSGPGGTKRSKLLEFLTSSPLRSAGESEDNGGDGNSVTASSPPIAARPITPIAPLPKPSLALEYSAMEPDSDDELVQEIQSILETTEPHAKNLAAAPSSPSSSSTSSDSSSSSSGEDVEGSGPGPQGRRRGRPGSCRRVFQSKARDVHLDREHLRPC